MAYDENLAHRIQSAFELFPSEIRENLNAKKMFGGIAYLYQGKMTVGIVKRDLMARVMGSKMDEVLQMKHVRPMDFTKRPMKEFVFVSQEGLTSEESLHYWIEMGLEHAKSKF